MASFNKVVLMGNLTRAPEIRYTPKGTAVCSLGLAVNRTYKTQSGELREEPCFIDVTVWGKQADNCASYLEKGANVLIEGELKQDSWVDSETQKNRYKHLINATSVTFLGSPKTKNESSPEEGIPNAMPAN